MLNIRISMIKRSFSSSISSIGFLGLGKMGKSMCLNLAKKTNNHIIIYDKRKETILDILNENKQSSIQSSDSIASLAQSCTVIITMLPNREIMKTVCLDERTGLFDNMKKNTLFIDCTTNDPEYTIDIEAKARLLGIKMIDAPVRSVYTVLFYVYV